MAFFATTEDCMLGSSLLKTKPHLPTSHQNFFPCGWFFGPLWGARREDRSLRLSPVCRPPAPFDEPKREATSGVRPINIKIVERREGVASCKSIWANSPAPILHSITIRQLGMCPVLKALDNADVVRGDASKTCPCLSCCPLPGSFSPLPGPS